MKKFVLSAAIAALMVSAPTAMAQDMNLGFNGSSYMSAAQQQFRSAPAIGISYTYRFGAPKAEEYGTLNLRNFAGRNIPVMNFSSQGTRPSQFVLNATGDGEGMSSKNWLYILGGAAVIVGGVLLLDGEDEEEACVPPRVLINGQCLRDDG